MPNTASDRPANKQRRTVLAAVGGVVLTLAAGLSSAIPGLGGVANAASSISGVAFLDSNFDGVNNEGAGGVSGISVKVYDDSGSEAGSSTTDAGGLFTVTATGSGPYRVEFTGFPAGMQAGKGPDTTVQFVASGSQDPVNLPVVAPSDYCGSVQSVATTCFGWGPHDGEHSGDNAIVAVTKAGAISTIATVG